MGLIAFAGLVMIVIAMEAFSGPEGGWQRIPVVARVMATTLMVLLVAQWVLELL